MFKGDMEMKRAEFKEGNSENHHILRERGRKAIITDWEGKIRER